MTEVIMPKMGDGMEEGTLLEWLKKEGEKVQSGEVIGTIQTDKATLELESPGSGILSGFLITTGETVPVGRPIAFLLKEGEELPADWQARGKATNGAGAKAAAAPAKVPASAPAVTPAAAPATTPSGRIKASPLAKKIAAQNGIDLSTLTGTGPGGRIIEADVKTAIESKGASISAPQVQKIVATAEDKFVPLNRLRQIIAQRTQESKLQAPHFYVTVEVDVEKILDLRKMFEDEESGKVSVNDFVVKASALALQEMPEVNSSFQGDGILQYGAVNIGIAAAVDEGLLVPVIKNAHAMTLREISAVSKELVKKAREGKLHPDEMSSSTFSISNMGMLDVDQFGAIINQPNSAIVAVGTARKKVVPTADDEIEIRSRMNLTGSFDHRVVDGAIGAKFMNILKNYLENPTRLLS